MDFNTLSCKICWYFSVISIANVVEMPELCSKQSIYLFSWLNFTEGYPSMYNWWSVEIGLGNGFAPNMEQAIA